MTISEVVFKGHRRSSTGSKGFVVYDIDGKDENGSVVSSVAKRYSELLHFHREAAKKVPGLPRFPPKKWFGNKLPAFLDRRQEDLSSYFNSALKLGNAVMREVDGIFSRPTHSDHSGVFSPSKSEPDATEEEVDVSSQVLEKISRQLIDANADFPTDVSDDEKQRRLNVYRGLAETTGLGTATKMSFPAVSEGHDAASTLRSTEQELSLRETAVGLSEALKNCVIESDSEIVKSAFVSIEDVLE
mmetsp:Transcript_24031/g.60869  ORF Transcript_24031/g.60869 Transcript_24031/m.60869 type:complete len:244 (+) Transcript_24031:130-861(+)